VELGGVVAVDAAVARVRHRVDGALALLEARGGDFGGVFFFWLLVALGWVRWVGLVLFCFVSGREGDGGGWGWDGNGDGGLLDRVREGVGCCGRSVWELV
jgi:hypothetical protein